MVNKQRLNIVWLKKDLRTQDHASLYAAEKSECPYLIIYCFEPSLLSLPDVSLRHQQFIYHSLREMKELPLNLFYAEAMEVFEKLNSLFALQRVWSYQESGNQASYKRDKALRRFFKDLGIPFIEFQRDGIKRGKGVRNGWEKQWYATMQAPLINNTYKKERPIKVPDLFPMPPSFIKKLEDYSPYFQKAGEKQGHQSLDSFLQQRGFEYIKALSKPSQSQKHGSRLSTYLSWGNLSIKQVYQKVKSHPNYSKHRFAFNAFLTRLRWHCHFIQKFETEIAYESHCINKGYELLKYERNAAWIQAWEKGQTGYPLVDACMRCVLETGWINFRMRAMLVSFLCHHLFQDWREGVYYLARQFLDYEIGIHFTQFQMQAGVTGINTLRVYNPLKQAIEQDPEGKFIKRWLPELKEVPPPLVFTPHKLSPMEEKFYKIKRGIDYPLPIVDHERAARRAKEKIWAMRAHPLVKQEKQRILKLHTHKKNHVLE